MDLLEKYSELIRLFTFTMLPSSVGSPYTENFAGAGNPLLYHHHHHSHHHPSHHSGNSDEEDESMLSDMASDRNAPLPRFNMAAAATMAAAANSTTDHTHAATSFMYQTPRPTYQQNPTNSLSATLTPSSQNGSIGLSHTLNSSVSRMEPIRGQFFSFYALRFIETIKVPNMQCY